MRSVVNITFPRRAAALFNQSVEPTRGSRCDQVAFVGLRRLPPVAHAFRWPLDTS